MEERQLCKAATFRRREVLSTCATCPPQTVSPSLSNSCMPVSCCQFLFAVRTCKMTITIITTNREALPSSGLVRTVVALAVCQLHSELLAEECKFRSRPLVYRPGFAQRLCMGFPYMHLHRYAGYKIQIVGDKESSSLFL